MAIDQHREELTDSYLRDELSQADRASFEQMMADDQSLSEYVSVQKGIVKGIADYRKLQIKARLDAIEVGTGWYFVGQGAWKVASSVVVAAAVGIGVYVYWPDQEVLEEVNPLEISENDITIDSHSDEVPSMPSPEETVVLETKTVERSEKIAKTKAVAEIESEKEVVVITENEKVAPAPREEFVPDVSKPTLSDIADESKLETTGADMPEAVPSEWIEKSDEPIDIKTIERRSSEIKYKYFEGKLFLYGDFKNEPYEILEINSVEAKQVYLFYMAKYYQIELTDDVKVLLPITDEKLIQELRIIRHNKVD